MEEFDLAEQSELAALEQRRKDLEEAIRDRHPDIKEAIIELYDSTPQGTQTGERWQIKLALNKLIKNRRDLTTALINYGVQPGTREFIDAYEKYSKSHNLPL